MFLDTIDKWKRCAEVLSKQAAIGLDSEFYGVDFSLGQSCVNRARIHVFSVALFTGEYSPLGYRTAKGCVLPVGALPYFKDVLENPAILKAAHNSNVDAHAFYNHGVDCQGLVNTLTLSRWCRPGRLLYNLDIMGEDELGAGKADSYDDLFQRENFVPVTKDRIVRLCRCGALKCKQKRYPHIHDRDIVQHITKMKRGKGKEKWYYIPITDCRPGHELWERFVKYARVDAIRALELLDKLNRTGFRTEIPWIRQSTSEFV